MLDEGLYLSNCQTNLVIALLLFCNFINRTAYHFGRCGPSSPSTKVLHGLACTVALIQKMLDCKSVFDIALDIRVAFFLSFLSPLYEQNFIHFSTPLRRQERVLFCFFGVSQCDMMSRLFFHIWAI